MSPPSPVCSFFMKDPASPPPQPQSCVIISKVLFKSVPALHQDVFYMLILGDMDPSLLCRSLMPGVPETAGKTVSARRSARTTRVSGRRWNTLQLLCCYCVCGDGGGVCYFVDNCGQSSPFVRSKVKSGDSSALIILQRPLRPVCC